MKPFLPHHISENASEERVLLCAWSIKIVERAMGSSSN
jgi:hypothetical protein